MKLIYLSLQPTGAIPHTHSPIDMWGLSSIIVDSLVLESFDSQNLLCNDTDVRIYACIVNVWLMQRLLYLSAAYLRCIKRRELGT